MTSLAVDAVFVGRPSVLGSTGGRPVLSGIVKQPSAADELELAWENLDGDEQADLSVHGGPDKAVYVYPSEHYPAWNAGGYELVVGAVGENVSVTGADESQVRVGDRWSWGTAEVEVSQPRSPCYKLGMRVGRKDVIPAMLKSVRCGWYLRVLRPGRVPTTGSMTLLERDPQAPTIADLHAAAHYRPAPGQEQAYRDLVEYALARPELAESWRGMLRHRLARP
ncbi:MAG TPA: MOSC domain-containing protein [Pseudonocardia sp.]